jgi:hypothetical protein
MGQYVNLCFEGMRKIKMFKNKVFIKIFELINIEVTE